DAISNDAYAYKVKQDIQEAYELGVTGVPFFVFDRKYAVSGAQPSDAFLNTLKASYDDWKAKQKSSFINISEEGASCDINGNCEL
ncbi:DsbA family protein, partial [Sphingobacterium mizutaii]